MRVVLDTNVFVSGIHWAGASCKVLGGWTDGKFDIVTSPYLLGELTWALLTFKLPIEQDTLHRLLVTIKDCAVLVKPHFALSVVDGDPDDNRVIEAAIAGNAAYIVTQDKHLLRIGEYKGIKILYPGEFSKFIHNV